VEWIMDYGASNHMFVIASFFSSYDTQKNASQNFSIGDGKQLLVVGFGNVKVPNGTLEYFFHVQGMPINLFYSYRACQQVYKF
jgi:hypothetical protein